MLHIQWSNIIVHKVYNVKDKMDYRRQYEIEIEFTDENFESEVIRSEIPVLVDFWEEGCGLCVVSSSVVEEVGKR